MNIYDILYEAINNDMLISKLYIVIIVKFIIGISK